MNDDRPRALSQHILARAPHYYHELGAATVRLRLVRTSSHKASTIYRFSLETSTLQRQVLAKSPPNVQRRREAVAEDPAAKFRHEYEALVDIHAHFCRLQDARFAAVQPLDFVPEWHTIIMEEARYPSMRDLFSRASRLQLWSYTDELQACFRHAGSWLRAFHLLARPQAVPRDSTREEFSALVEKYSGGLSAVLGEGDFFRELVAHTNARAQNLFPEVFPLGLTHGDYALRNLLVGPNHRVLALDTPAQWLMPIYEDLAYFLVGLATTWPQVLSQGLAFNSEELEVFEQVFLQGYFGSEAVPRDTIRLFKIKIMLLKWSANIHRIQRFRSGLATVRHRLMHRFYQRSLLQLMQAGEVLP